jgi:membrane protein
MPEVNRDLKRQLLDRRAFGPAGRGPLGHLRRWFGQEIWRLDAVPRKWGGRALRRLSRLVFLTLSGFDSDRCMVRASALTYTTLLSLVPLLAVCFSILKGLGWYEDFRQNRLQSWLDELAPAGQAGQQDFAQSLRAGIEKIIAMVDSTDVRGLQAIGLVLVIWAVVRLLDTIESAFNDIWGARRARSWVRKLTDYLAVVFVAPILIAISGGLTAAVNDSVSGVVGVDFTLLLSYLLRLSPLLLTWAAFAFVYAALPNTRTHARASLIGGFVAAVAWQVALALHVRFQIGVANFNAIYSTFAALPIFLIWVQLSWAIVLLGAELAYAVQHEGEFRRIVGWREPSPRERARLVVRVAVRLAQTFVEDAPPRSAAGLARELGVPSAPVEEALETLSAAGLAACSDDPDGGHWRVSRDPGRVSLSDVIDAALAAGGATSPSAGTLDRVVDRMLDQFNDERRGSAANLRLRELVEIAAREAAAEAEPVAQPAQPSGAGGAA